MSVLLGDEFAPVLAAAQLGEEWAVARLFRSLQPDLLRYLRARERWEADDVAAQTWLEVARALGSFAGDEDGFRAFVFTIARRRMLNARRSRTRRRRDERPVETLAPSLVARDDPAEETAAWLDSVAAVVRIAELLPPEQSDVVLLRVVGNLSVEDVAAIVGKRPATVRVIQHRALRRLAQELGDEA
jgi:RNA polymerase sigma-70 factor (ECF subfamily)